jgi:integrase
VVDKTAQKRHSPAVSKKPSKKRGDRLSWNYWADRVFHRSEVLSSSYYVRIEHGGVRKTINLGVADKSAAAMKAKDLYVLVRGKGWDAALQSLLPPDKKIGKRGPTIGQYIAAARAFFDGRQTTFEDYCRNLRQIVSEAFKIKLQGSDELIDGKAQRMALKALRDGQKAGSKEVPPRLALRKMESREFVWVEKKAKEFRKEAASLLRYDYRNKGRDAWVQAVDATPLADLTSATVKEWQVSRIRAAEKISPLARKSAEVSTATVIRQARSLFKKHMIPMVRTKMALPDPLPFAELKVEAGRISRFKVQVELSDLMQSAVTELNNDREVMKALLLAAGAGLRKREIDSLTWDALDEKKQTLSVAPTEHYGLKSRDSAAVIPLAPEIASFLSQCHKLEKAQPSDFMLKGDYKVNTKVRSYRCDVTFERLMEWLRGQGITDRKPIHHLRKLAGEAVARQAGIYAASRYLRHSGVKVTEASYVDGTAKVAPDIGSLLGDKVIAFPVAMEAAMDERKTKVSARK